MKTGSPQIHRVERVDDIPVLLATLQRLKVAEILDRHFPSGHRWKGELTFGEVAMAALDPLGMPVTTFVAPGNCANDPLYVPEIKKVQRAFGQGGKTFVCDCKAASLGTRAYLASTNDYYLCPLPETQVSAQQRRALLQPGWEGRQSLH